MLNFILQIEGVAAAATDTAAAALQTVDPAQVTSTSMSMIDMIKKGGPIMYPMAVMLIAVVYILIERLLVLMKANKRNDTIIMSLKEMIHSGNISNARAMCKSLNTPESTMLEQGVSRIGQPVQEIRTAMDKSGSLEVLKLEKNLNVLNIIGRIAPMFGFIGTILGVITIFYDISLAKTVEIEIISKGLYQKMITSASGLVVGVLAFICYHWLNSKIDKVAHRMEEAQVNFLDMLNEPSK